MWLPSEHPPGYRMRPVDRCIAPLVAALRHAGYETTGSCCGHGKGDASVLLADGREVRVEAGHPQPERCPHQTYGEDTRCVRETGHEGPHATATVTPGPSFSRGWHSQATPDRDMTQVEQRSGTDVQGGHNAVIPATPDTERPRVEGSSTTTHLCNCTDPDCYFVHRPRTPDSTPEDAELEQVRRAWRGEQQPGGEPE